MSQSRTACLELEQLAAFIDGCLDGEERQQVVEHLEGCASCYALFTDTIQLQEDDASTTVDAIGETVTSPEPAEPLAAVAEHPSSHGRRWWLSMAAVAAVALIAVSAFYWLGPLGPPQPFEAAVLAQRAVGDDIEVEGLWLVPDRGWPIFRGLEDYFLTTEQRWFQLGVESVALPATLTADHAQAALEHLESEILPLLDSINFVGPMLVLPYLELRQQLEDGASPQHLLETAAFAEQVLGKSADPIYYSLGQWAEAGRLAAVTQQRGYFKKRSVRRYPERLAEVELSPELRQEVTVIERLLNARSRDLELSELDAAFARLIDLGGG